MEKVAIPTNALRSCSALRELHEGQEEVLARFETSGSGPDVLPEMLLTDQLVRVVFEIATERVYPTANKTTSEQLSVVAIGGYGRGQLALTLTSI